MLVSQRIEQCQLSNAAAVASERLRSGRHRDRSQAVRDHMRPRWIDTTGTQRSSQTTALANRVVDVFLGSQTHPSGAIPVPAQQIVAVTAAATDRPRISLHERRAEATRQRVETVCEHECRLGWIDRVGRVCAARIVEQATAHLVATQHHNVRIEAATQTDRQHGQRKVSVNDPHAKIPCRGGAQSLTTWPGRRPQIFTNQQGPHTACWATTQITSDRPPRDLHLA